MNRLTFSVAGEPRGKGRPRFSARVVEVDGTPTAISSVHTPADTLAAEKVVATTFKAMFPKHQPYTRAVMLKFVAVFAVPSSWPKYMKEAAKRGTLYHTSKPDKDNIEKLIVDALNTLAWVDDAQVQGGGVKRYGHPARIEITIEAIEQPDVPATPGQKRAEAAQLLPPQPKPQKARPVKQTKPETKSKYPPALRAAIDAALERDGAR